MRRVAALAVCAVGGAALYLAPLQLGDARSQLTQPLGTTTAPQDQSSLAATQTNAVPSVTSVPSPSLHQDRTLPTPVRQLRLSGNTAETYTVTWGPSHDAAGIRHYVVLANGFLVGRTRVPTITLVWQTSTSNILVQVAAIDGNGLQGEWRALMIVPPPLQHPHHTVSTRPPSVPASQSPTPPLPSNSPSVDPRDTHSPSGAPSSQDPCSTHDATHTATATTSQDPSASPTLTPPETTVSPSAKPTATGNPTTSLSSEPGMPPTDGPTGIPSC